MSNTTMSHTVGKAGSEHHAHDDREFRDRVAQNGAAIHRFCQSNAPSPGLPDRRQRFPPPARMVVADHC